MTVRLGSRCHSQVPQRGSRVRGGFNVRCRYGDGLASYGCAQTGEYLCLEHARLAVVWVATREKLPVLPGRRVERRVTVG